MNTTIYGHEIELEAAEPDEMVVDVIVIARVLRPTDDGRMEDALCISTTKTTTAIVQMGMAVAFAECAGGME